jgi:MFS family permease
MASTLSGAMRTTERPTKVRYWVIFFAVTLAVITYIDRVALSLSSRQISADLHLSDVQMGWVFFAFGAAYALFEIPTGVLGDKIGPRKVLMRIVLWWSFFTAATGAAWNLVSLFLTQLLFGAGEAGCFLKYHPRFFQLVAAIGTSPLAGDHLAECPMGRRVHSSSGRFSFQVHDVASGLSHVRTAGRPVDLGVLFLVPR